MIKVHKLLSVSFAVWGAGVQRHEFRLCKEDSSPALLCSVRSQLTVLDSARNSWRGSISCYMLLPQF